MTNSIKVKVAFGLVLMFTGIILMHVFTPVLSIVLVAAGSFMAAVSIWDYFEVFRTPPYTNSYMNEWR
jgi:thiol:disulfide interchange protein